MEMMGDFNTYHTGNPPAIELLSYDQRTMNAVREIRKMIQPWGDGDHARLIRAVLDKYRV
jgi:hypothetical protein